MDKDQVQELLNKTPDELNKMTKNSVHEGYKGILRYMLMDFFKDITSRCEPFENKSEVAQYIFDWVENHSKPASEDWKPGDQYE
jgi:hypothetical protein